VSRLSPVSVNENFAAFNRFLQYFSTLFSRPGVLDGAACRQSYKDYVVNYYRDQFGPNAVLNSSRNLRWFRRLGPILALPRGSRVLDYGGGYGMDTIFLASLGYKMVFYEMTPHHIGVARWFAERFGTMYGELPVQYCLAGTDPDPTHLDAVLADEVAHHIEPARHIFNHAAKLLRSGGHFFLLEPNFLCPTVQMFFFRVRGFRTTKSLVNERTGERYLWGNEHIRPIWTWNRFARDAGFVVDDVHYYLPWFRGAATDMALLGRQGIERLPVARSFLASHITMHYAKRL